jgi:hypothetical protein
LFSSFTLTTTTEIKQIVIAARVAAIHGSACGIQQDNSTLVDGWITATCAVMTPTKKSISTYATQRRFPDRLKTIVGDSRWGDPILECTDI